MRKFRFKSLKVRLIVSIFVIITAVYALFALVMLLAYHGGAFEINEENYYANAQQFGGIVMLLIFMLISIIIGLLVFYRFNDLFLRPIDELSVAMKEVEKGNYDVAVSNDVKIRELYRLMNGFNQMAKEISSVELLKKDFISYFSHEFKTPIASIQGFSRQIKEVDLPLDKQREYADIIYRESDRLIKMAGNVLMLTKLEHQNMLTEINEYSLDEQLRRTLLLLESKWSDKEIELQLELDEIAINSNEELVKQIWINVISNAINYSKQKSEIKISCKIDGDYALVRIRDYGRGMPVEVRERIFEKFYQGDESHSAGGNGLGMPIVKRIVDLSGGKIIVRSRIDEGTTVLVYLPLAPIKIEEVK